MSVPSSAGGGGAHVHSIPLLSHSRCQRWMQHGLRIHGPTQGPLFDLLVRWAGARECAPMTILGCETLRSTEALEACWRPMHGAARQTQLMHESATFCSGERAGFLPLVCVLVQPGPPAPSLKVLRVEGPANALYHWLAVAVHEYARDVSSYEQIPVELLKAIIHIRDDGKEMHVLFPHAPLEEGVAVRLFELYPALYASRPTDWLHQVFDMHAFDNNGCFWTGEDSDDDDDDDHEYDPGRDWRRDGTREARKIFRLTPLEPARRKTGRRGPDLPEVQVERLSGEPTIYSMTHNAYQLTAAAFAVLAHVLRACKKMIEELSRHGRMGCQWCGMDSAETRTTLQQDQWHDALHPMKRVQELVASHRLRTAPLPFPCWGCRLLRTIARGLCMMVTHDPELCSLHHDMIPVGRLLSEARSFVQPIRRAMRQQMLRGASTDRAGMPFSLYPCSVCTCDLLRLSARWPCELHGLRRLQNDEKPDSPSPRRPGDTVEVRFDSLPGITLDGVLETTLSVLRNEYSRGDARVLRPSDDRLGLVMSRDLWERVVADCTMRTVVMSNNTRESALTHDCSCWTDRELAYHNMAFRRGLDSFAYVLCDPDGLQRVLRRQALEEQEAADGGFGPWRPNPVGRWQHCARGGSYTDQEDRHLDGYLPWTYAYKAHHSRAEPLKPLKDQIAGVQERKRHQLIHPMRCLHLHYLQTWPLSLRTFLYGSDVVMPSACGWLRQRLYGGAGSALGDPTQGADLFDQRGVDNGRWFSWKAARMLPFLLRKAVGDTDQVLRALTAPFARGETSPGRWDRPDAEPSVYRAVWSLLQPTAPMVVLGAEAARCIIALLERDARPEVVGLVETLRRGWRTLVNPAGPDSGGRMSASDPMAGLYRAVCHHPQHPHRYVPLHYLFYHLALQTGDAETVRAVFMGVGVRWSRMPDEDPPAADEVEPHCCRNSHYTYANTHPVCALQHSTRLLSEHARAMLTKPRYRADALNTPTFVGNQARDGPGAAVAVRPRGTVPMTLLNSISTPRDFLTLEELNRRRPRQVRPAQSLAEEMAHGWYACNLGPGGVLEPSYYEALEALFAGLEVLSFFSTHPSDVPAPGESPTECVTPSTQYDRRLREEIKQRKSHKRKFVDGDDNGGPAPKRRRTQCQADQEVPLFDEDRPPFRDDVDGGDGPVEIDLANLLPVGADYQRPDFARLSMLTPNTGNEGAAPGPNQQPLLETGTHERFEPQTRVEMRYLRRLARLMFAGQCGGPDWVSLDGKSPSEKPRRQPPQALRGAAAEAAHEWARRVVLEHRWAGLPEPELRTHRALLQPYQIRALYQFEGSRTLVDRAPDSTHAAPLPAAYSDFGTYSGLPGKQQPHKGPLPDRLHWPERLFPLWHTQWRPVQADHIYLRHVVNIRGDTAPLVQSHPQLLPALLTCTVDRMQLGPDERVDMEMEFPLVRESFGDVGWLDDDGGKTPPDTLGFLKSLIPNFDIYGSMLDHSTAVAELIVQ